MTTNTNAMMKNQSPEETASALLAKHNGRQRAAEVEAWQHQSGVDKDHPLFDYWGAVARAIVFGGEFPKVERAKPNEHPTI